MQESRDLHAVLMANSGRDEWKHIWNAITFLHGARLCGGGQVTVLMHLRRPMLQSTRQEQVRKNRLCYILHIPRRREPMETLACPCGRTSASAASGRYAPGPGTQLALPYLLPRPRMLLAGALGRVADACSTIDSQQRHACHVVPGPGHDVRNIAHMSPSTQLG